MAPNPAELLGEDAFARLVEWARNRYDTIIIDTPPLGSVIDTIISQRWRAILVVKAGRSVIAWCRKQNQLERTGCRILEPY